MDVDGFKSMLEPVLRAVAGGSLDESLATRLQEEFAPGGEVFEGIAEACVQAVEAGWMCAHGGEGRRYGRIIESSPATGGLSVDVVDLIDLVGPHHRHPTGEVCMVMPLTDGARFDGHPRGWCVYPPGSDHRPTVTGGEALVLYMLPGGEIEFTGT